MKIEIEEFNSKDIIKDIKTVKDLKTLEKSLNKYRINEKKRLQTLIKEFEASVKETQDKIKNSIKDIENEEKKDVVELLTSSLDNLDLDLDNLNKDIEDLSISFNNDNVINSKDVKNIMTIINNNTHNDTHNDTVDDTVDDNVDDNVDDTKKTSVDTVDFENYIENNFRNNLKIDSISQFGNMKEYRKRASASKISQSCAYKVVQDSKIDDSKISLKQLIIFQRGHIAETIIKKMLVSKNLKLQEQYKIVSEFNGEKIEANIDFLIKSPKKIVIVEAKTISSQAISEPYESWILQVQFQMGIVLEKYNFNIEIEAYIVALNLNTGYIKVFKEEFNEDMFSRALDNTEHLINAFKGYEKPRAIPQYFCGTCPHKLKCPAQGGGSANKSLAKEFSKDIKEIKDFKIKAKELALKEEAIKEKMILADTKRVLDLSSETVISITDVESKRFDSKKFREDYPDIYKRYLNKSSSKKMTII